VSLTALVVLVAASLVASAQAQYSCTDPVLCQYGVRNDSWCSSSSSACVNGKWKTYCVRGTELSLKHDLHALMYVHTAEIFLP
jgi:hypothetical protein